MEVKPGYKQTEVGVIPEDWEQTSINEFTIKVGSGVTPTGGSKRYKEFGHPFVRSQNVGWGNLLLDDLVYIDDETHNDFPATELKQGDVLLNITGASIGRSAIVDERLVNGNVNQHVCIIRVEENKVLPRFLNCLLLSSLGQHQIESFQAGGNRQGLNFTQIKSIIIPLPPTNAEQRTIARVLSDIDKLIESLERLIAKKRAVKQGAMQELLTGRRRLPGFSGEWEVKRLGDIASFVKGRGIGKSDLDPYGTNECIHYGELFTEYPEKIKNIHCRTNVTEKVFRSRVNDVLMPTSDVTPNGLATASCILNDDVILGGDILVIRDLTNQLNGTFLSYLIRFHRNQILQLVKGTTVFHLHGSDMEKFTFPLPSLSEQNEIVNILSDIDEQINELVDKMIKTRLIKQGMMQELLTGRIRLI